MRKDEALSEGQVRVLQWVNEGCPDGVWSDFTYKTTAYALAARGLVKVDRRRNHWAATITDEGELYLAHGSYSSNPAAAADNPRSPGAHSDADTLAAEILDRLMSGEKKLVLAAPSEPQRARYRRALHRLLNSGQIPEGFALKHTGRDRGDLAIRLVHELEEPRPEPTSTVTVPESMTSVTDGVRALGTGVLVSVTDASMERALRILQAIANESTARGWTLEPKPTDDRKFRITRAECHFDMRLSEELIDRALPDNEQLGAAKYAWQRVSLHMRKVGSGRLTLQLGHYSQTKSWSDRRRWTLDDKLARHSSNWNAESRTPPSSGSAEKRTVSGASRRGTQLHLRRNWSMSLI